MHRKRRVEHEIPMASMSDIAFILIVFFIITISFVYKQGLSLTLPKQSSKPVIMKKEDIISLKLNSSGKLFENDKPITPDGIVPGGRDVAIVKVEGKCPYKYLVELMEVLRQKNIEKISLKEQ